MSEQRNSDTAQVFVKLVKRDHSFDLVYCPLLVALYQSNNKSRGQDVKFASEIKLTKIGQF